MGCEKLDNSGKNNNKNVQLKCLKYPMIFLSLENSFLLDLIYFERNMWWYNLTFSKFWNTTGVKRYININIIKFTKLTNWIFREHSFALAEINYLSIVKKDLFSSIFYMKSFWTIFLEISTLPSQYIISYTRDNSAEPKNFSETFLPSDTDTQFSDPFSLSSLPILE